MKKINSLNQGLNRLKDCTDWVSVKSKNPCHLCNPRIRQNHRLNGFKDYTEIESNQFKNPCNPRNQNKSVIQTKSAEILNSILELI